MIGQESMDLGDKSRRRGSAPKAGSVWESRMKIDKVKGGIKVFDATDEISSQNTQNSIPKSEIEISITNQSPIGKRKTWKSESLDGSPEKIAAFRSELSDGIKRSPISIKKSSLRKVRDDGSDGKNEGKAKASIGERIKNSVVEDEREKKLRSDEDCEEVGVCEEMKATISSNETQIHGKDELDFDQDEEIEVQNKSVDVRKLAVNDLQPKRIVIEEKKLVHSNQRSVPISPIVKKQPFPTVNNQTTAKFNRNPDNIQRIPRTRSKLQSFVDLVMWQDASKSAFVFGTGTFAIISSSYTRDLNISFISLLSYLGLVYLAAIFLFRSLISRGSVEKDNANQDCVIGEEEAIWMMKKLLPCINEFLLKLRALFSGDPATTMKLAVVLFILARCGSSITIWTMAKLGFIGVFTVPIICSTYSSQIAAYVAFWIRRFGDAWESCSHKKAVAFAVFTLVWNLSSLVARIWSVFMLFVAFKHYQQSSIKEEAINAQDPSCQEKGIRHTTTIPNTGIQKKVC